MWVGIYTAVLIRRCRKFQAMCTATTVPTLVAAFSNDRLGLCANVRELSESEEFEVAVVDAFSGDVVVSRSFSTKEIAVKTAETLVDFGSLQGE